jgi:hypothetical protein
MLQQQSSNLAAVQNANQEQNNDDAHQSPAQLTIENPVSNNPIEQSQEDPPPYNDVPTDFNAVNPANIQQEPEIPWVEPAHNKSLVRKLVPNAVRFDMASGRVRFFGEARIEFELYPHN